MNKIIFFSTSMLILASCSNSMQHKLGINETLPDEYQVKKLNPLKYPSSFKLPEPVDATEEQESGKSTIRHVEDADGYSPEEKALLEQTHN